MRGSYFRPLKVYSPEGKQVVANILRFGDRVQIEIAPLEVVRKDDPPFAHDGLIRYTATVEKYRETIRILTRYLENLFLKGMADEDIYSSLGAKSKSRRTEKINIGRKAEKPKREGSVTSLHARARRAESSKSSRGRNTDVKVAESSDKEISGEDHGGD